MENNTPVLAKKVWSLIRVAFYMLRKGVSKGKLMMDLNTMLKRRRKLASKAITNLMFHHHASSVSSRQQFTAAREYEFSCSNTPNNFFALGSHKRNRHNNLFTRSHAQPALDDHDDMVTANAVKAVLEMLNNEALSEASPALPGFGRSPMVRKLIRVTDSPFPLQESEIERDGQVDKHAEEFIKRFYLELRQQA